MKAQWFVLLNLAFFSLTAMAFPHASLNQLTQTSDPNCSQSGSEDGLRDLITQVNLVARKNAVSANDDPRGLLSKKAPELGISKENQIQLSKTVGDIVCPGTSGNSAQGTGVLVGDGGQILTNAHILEDDSGRLREPLRDCFWQNKEIPFQRISLEISPTSVKFFTKSIERDWFKDLAIVRLKRHVSGAHPFRLDGSGIPLRKGDRIFMASAFQGRMASLKLNSEIIRTRAKPRGFIFEYSPEVIIQDGTINAVSRTTDVVTTNGIYSDLWGTEGTSGSPIFTVSNSGEITIVGIHKGGGSESADHTEFTLDEKAPKGQSYSYAIQLNREITDEIEVFEATNEKGRTEANASPSKPVRKGI